MSAFELTDFVLMNKFDLRSALRFAIIQSVPVDRLRLSTCSMAGAECRRASVSTWICLPVHKEAMQLRYEQRFR